MRSPGRVMMFYRCISSVFVRIMVLFVLVEEHQTENCFQRYFEKRYHGNVYDHLSTSRRREAPCEGTNSPRLFTPGETKALAKSKVHQ